MLRIKTNARLYEQIKQARYWLKPCGRGLFHYVSGEFILVPPSFVRSFLDFVKMSAFYLCNAEIQLILGYRVKV